MNQSLQDAIKEAYTLVPADQVILQTLEIRQEGVQDPLYIIDSRLPFTADDENGVSHTYTPVGFQITLPPSNEDGTQALNITIDNINRSVTDFIQTALSQEVPVTVIYRPYMNDDPSAPQFDPPLVLYLKDIQVSIFQVSAKATFMDIINKKFPSELYTRARFPTLG